MNIEQFIIRNVVVNVLVPNKVTSNQSKGLPKKSPSIHRRQEQSHLPFLYILEKHQATSSLVPSTNYPRTTKFPEKGKKYKAKDTSWSRRRGTVFGKTIPTENFLIFSKGCSITMDWTELRLRVSCMYTNYIIFVVVVFCIPFIYFLLLVLVLIYINK